MHLFLRRVRFFFQFSMWSHDVVATSIGLAGDLKLGQYLKVWGVFLEMLARDAHGVP